MISNDKMDLLEAIKHCDETIQTRSNVKCACDHIQLKEWLEELLMYRKAFANVMEIYFEKSAEKIKNAK